MALEDGHLLGALNGIGSSEGPETACGKTLWLTASWTDEAVGLA